MEPEFWIERWNASLIGFHQDEVNSYLQQHWRALALPPGNRVFVPLCGKSLDMLWLRSQGYEVLGVELSGIAVDAFFSENGLVPEVDSIGAFRRLRCDGITLLEGDFFDLDESMLAGVGAIYDRASLIALPHQMRRAYVEKLRELFNTPIQSLLVTMEYAQHQMNGPPFSVNDKEINELFGGWSHVEKTGEHDILGNEAKFRERGVDFLQENLYLITMNSR